MTKQRVIIVLAVILLLLGGTGAFLYSNLERYTVEVNTGPKLDVALNPWYAAQQFLKYQNIESHRAMDLQAMLHRLNANDTIVLFNDSPIYDTAQQQKLMQWIQQGGHLILTASYEWDEEEGSSDDPFLDALGVRMQWAGGEDDEESDDDEDDDTAEQDPGSVTDLLPGIPEQVEQALEPPSIVPQKEDTESKDQTACPIYSSYDLFKVAYAAEHDPLLINFGYSYTLNDVSGNAVSKGEAEHNGVLQYNIGAGHLTVLLTADIWTNKTIGDYDHAFLLWHLVQASPIVWLVANHDSENLITLLWRNARYLMISAGILILCWGWRRGVRFGPMLPEQNLARRQLLEHIEASALFSWKHQQIEPLLHTVRDDIWQHLNRLHGFSHNGHDDDKALAKLAELSRQSVEQVRHAMTAQAPTREQHWIELISQLQLIRKAL